jgi:hypothetical protein
MNRPTEADYRASRRGGVKVAVLAAIGLAAMVIAGLSGHLGIAILLAAATFAGVWLEGLPKAARARRRYPQ